VTLLKKSDGWAVQKIHFSKYLNIKMKWGAIGLGVDLPPS